MYQSLDHIFISLLSVWKNEVFKNSTLNGDIALINDKSVLYGYIDFPIDLFSLGSNIGNMVKINIWWIMFIKNCIIQSK